MKENRAFILFSLILFIAIFTIENINQRFWLNDFKVYYSAADALKNGTAVYGQSFGLSTGFYKYSPFILLCFLPACLFSFAFASSLHFFLIGTWTVLSLLMLKIIFDPNKLQNKRSNIIMVLALICIANHLVRELHLGNVNMLIVFLLCACFYFDAKNKFALSGVSLALALLIKPYLLVLGLPFLLHKKHKTIWYCILSCLAAILVFTAFYGIGESLSLHKQWLKAMMEHNSYLESAHTIAAILNHCGIHLIQQSQQLMLLLFLLIIYSATHLFLQSTNQTEQHPFSLHISVFILLAILPNVLITDTEHFLFSLPLIFYNITQLFKLKNKILNGIFTIIGLGYGANSSDLLGNTLSNQFEKWGILGLANIALIIFTIYILKFRKNKIPSSGAIL